MKEEEIEAVSVEGEVVGVAAREVEEGEVRGLVGVEVSLFGVLGLLRMKLLMLWVK